MRVVVLAVTLAGVFCIPSEIDLINTDSLVVPPVSGSGDTVDLSNCHQGCGGRGSCVQVGEEFNCVCPENFYGAACQYSSHPPPVIVKPGCPAGCSGRGICRMTDWTCQCEAGFEGKDCGRLSAAAGCDHFGFCSGQGHCVLQTGLFICMCDPGFQGVDCSIAVDLCGGCRHGLCAIETSVAGIVTAGCECFKGFSGDHCDQYIPGEDPCLSSNFCNANGHCLEGTGVCMCDVNGAGSDTHCYLNPALAPTCPGKNRTEICNNAGLCNMDLTCTCNDGYTGKGCQFEPCPGGCGENGICMKQPDNSWMCSCDDGYVGTQCQVDTLAVTDTPCCENECSHQGICHLCVCSCFDGFTGQTCETRVVVTETDATADLNY